MLIIFLSAATGDSVGYTEFGINFFLILDTFTVKAYCNIRISSFLIDIVYF